MLTKMKHMRKSCILQSCTSKTLLPKKACTLDYLITVHNEKLEKLLFIWFAKKDNLMLLYFALSINLNAQHVNGMNHYDFEGFTLNILNRKRLLCRY